MATRDEAVSAGPKVRYLGRVHNTPVDQVDTVPWESTCQRSVVSLVCTEFTSRCPVTEQPDFGRLEISYSPKDRIIETKSLKLYLWTYREVKAFNEVIVHTILDDLSRAVDPRWMSVRGEFNVRGGISVTAVAEAGVAP